jgi:hypothetical protein
LLKSEESFTFRRVAKILGDVFVGPTATLVVITRTTMAIHDHMHRQEVIVMTAFTTIGAENIDESFAAGLGR